MKETETDTMALTMVKMVYDRWNTQIKNCDVLLDSLTEAQMERDTSPGKNRGVYILGHLIAVHDAMLPLLGLGNKQYDYLTEQFITSPDKASGPLPSHQVLMELWKKQIAYLAAETGKISAEEWFSRHTAVTEAEFLNEPHRNKLNILLTRTTHLAYHWGQLMLLK